MPNPVPLATREEEERRAWVTSHHEVVRLIKDCFGDRFSNNEIFDRLKISRRTGYRALGNDERIGKAPGRKPKIMDETIREMVEYIENGGCADVGNVWKHLAEKFAPDCNPKTVQDAVKKYGFINRHSSVKLDPHLYENLPADEPAPNEERAAAELQQQEEAEQSTQQMQHTPQASHETQPPSHEQPDVFDPALQQSSVQPQPVQHHTQAEGQQHETPQQDHQQHQSVGQPSVQPAHDALRIAIESGPDRNIRWVLHHLVDNIPAAAEKAFTLLCTSAYSSQAPSAPPMVHMGSPAGLPATPYQHHLHASPMTTPDTGNGRRRMAVCRRCGQTFDRTENTMELRECLYHKGSPQKINLHVAGTIHQVPEAFIWSCCGGNGNVRGCCRAMHTTKKKRKYSSKKRDATTAGLDDAGSGEDVDESTISALEHVPMQQANGHVGGAQAPHMNSAQAQALQQHNAQPTHASGGSGGPSVLSMSPSSLNDPNIDSSLQDLPPHVQHQIQMPVSSMPEQMSGEDAQGVAQTMQAQMQLAAATDAVAR